MKCHTILEMGSHGLSIWYRKHHGGSVEIVVVVCGKICGNMCGKIEKLLDWNINWCGSRY